MTIYLDLIILANFLLDYCLIMYTGIINRQNVKIGRVLCATLFALSSLSLFFIPYEFLFIICRILFSFIIIYLAFSFLSWKQYLKNLMIFYFLNYLTAGIIVSYDFSFTNRTISINYNEATTWYILIISFIFANILTYIFKVIEEMQGILNQKVIDVKFNFLGKEYSVKGLIDTGNLATSLGDNLPVVFIDKDIFDLTIDENFLISNQVKFTYIITNTINSSKVTLAFRPESFTIIFKNKSINRNVYLALTENKCFKDKAFQVILNSFLI